VKGSSFFKINETSCVVLDSLAAAFGAPIGGVLFSMEEASSFWSRKVLELLKMIYVLKYFDITTLR